MAYGKSPELLGHFDLSLPEYMHYLYLPILMGPWELRLPPNLICLKPLITEIYKFAPGLFGSYKYIYVSAIRGIASPGNALNRPGWHADGFGTEDLNVICWKGPGTRFAEQEFSNISDNEHDSLNQFEEQIDSTKIVTYNEGDVLLLDPYVVHAVPVIKKVCERQFVKFSFSDHKYNLEGNSHNYLFDYDWPMISREAARNVTNKDFVK